MGDEIVPVATPVVVTPAPTDPPQGKTITCEGCGSRVDRRGNLLRRGERLKEALDGEETIDKLRKDLAKLNETIAEKDATIADLRSQIKPAKQSWLKREV